MNRLLLKYGQLPQWRKLDGWLSGRPDTALSIILIGFAVVSGWVALFGPKPVKAAAVIYFLLP